MAADDAARLPEADRYTVDALQLLMRMVEVLADQPVEGLAPGQVAKACECSASQVTRYMENLRQRGWAEQIDATGRWRLGPAAMRLFVKHTTAIDRAQRKLDEVKARFGGGLA